MTSKQLISMNKILSAIVAILLLVAAGCYKDKGNYTYQPPEEPVVSKLDTVYNVFVGDSLVVNPTVTTSKGNQHLSLEWKIIVPEEMREIFVKGPALRIVFGLQAQRYNARLTIMDSSNGMKYFHSFVVSGKTSFSKGITVLSREGSTSQLSFVKPDGTVQARIYEAVVGEALAGGPQQVIPMVHQFIAPVGINSYWITCSQGASPGSQIDANTFKKIKDIRGNFFDAPATIQPGRFECSSNGVLMGVLNGKIYVGTSQTWSGSPVYGMFGLPAEGNYNLFPQAVFNGIAPYFIGYDKDKKRFVGFTNFGSPAYIDTNYQVAGAPVTDLRQTGLDLLYFTQINGGNCYAFGKAADGTLYEQKFGAAFMGFIQLSPIHKRAFVQPALITPTTLWASTPAEIFYFTSGAVIYRYNPLNQEVKPLTTDFGGKPVTMIKVADNGSTLMAGTEGSLYFLDVSTGKFGDIKQRIDGLPGTTIDAAVRN
jgi:hypothetical protein